MKKNRCDCPNCLKIGGTPRSRRLGIEIKEKKKELSTRTVKGNWKMVKNIQVLKFMLMFPLWLSALPIVIIIIGIVGAIKGSINETKEEIISLTKCWINILNDWTTVLPIKEVI